MKYISNIFITLFGLILTFGTGSCKKEEKILQKEENQTINGTWYTNKIKFNDLLNGTQTVNVDYEDYKPSVIVTELDDLPSQMTFNSDGTYNALSHRLGIYFALVGNVKDKNYKYGGVWQFIADGKKLYFDKGVYEFEGGHPRYFNITLLSPDSLKMETTEPQAIYDWAKLNGRSIVGLDDLPTLINACSGGSTKFGGTELASKFATYKGYLDAAKDAPVEFNAFGLGLRKGSVEQFDAYYKTIQSQFPIADSCYKSNFTTAYNNGFNQAKNQIANYKFRTQKLTFIFSRHPNAE